LSAFGLGFVASWSTFWFGDVFGVAGGVETGGGGLAVATIRFQHVGRGFRLGGIGIGHALSIPLRTRAQPDPQSRRWFSRLDVRHIGYRLGMDAITLLKNDHKTVEKLLKRFEKTGAHAYVEKRNIVDRLIEELSVHAAIEEQLFYPVCRATVPTTEDIALESLEEHHIVKWTLQELADLDASDERFRAKVTVLTELIRHHVKEEENDFFPKVRDELSRNALTLLGDAMVEAKKTAPTRPHPKAPDSAPANIVVGAVSGVVDRLNDTVSGVAQGSVSAVADLVARILHTKRRPAGTAVGSTRTRREATRVRSGASGLTDNVVDTIRASEAGAKETVKAARSGAADVAATAKSGVKGTATTARRSARSTRTTAKKAVTSTRRSASSAAEQTAKTARKAAKKTASASSS